MGYLECGHRQTRAEHEQICSLKPRVLSLPSLCLDLSFCLTKNGEMEKWRNRSDHGPSLILTETRERSSYPLNTYVQRQTAQIGKALSYESCTQTHCHTQARFIPHYMQTYVNNV